MVPFTKRLDVHLKTGLERFVVFSKITQLMKQGLVLVYCIFLLTTFAF